MSRHLFTPGLHFCKQLLFSCLGSTEQTWTVNINVVLMSVVLSKRAFIHWGIWNRVSSALFSEGSWLALGSLIIVICKRYRWDMYSKLISLFSNYCYRFCVVKNAKKKKSLLHCFTFWVSKNFMSWGAIQLTKTKCETHTVTRLFKMYSTYLSYTSIPSWQ